MFLRAATNKTFSPGAPRKLLDAPPGGDPIADALVRIHEAVLLLWVTGDQVFRAMRSASHLHPENKDALIEFFAPCIQYMGEITRMCSSSDRKTLVEASNAFMAALRDADKSPASLQNSLKSGQLFRSVSTNVVSSIDESHRDIIRKLNATVDHKPDIGWLAFGIVDAHNLAYARFILPTRKYCSQFSRKCTRKGLSIPHHGAPWKHLNHLLTSKFPPQK